VRAVSNIVTVLLLITVVIACLAGVGVFLTQYVKSRQPKGETISAFLVAQRALPNPYGIGTVKATLYITCEGPHCSEYSVKTITLNAVNNNGSAYTLSTEPGPVALKSGVTKIDVLGYYSSNQTFQEIVVSYYLCDPDGKCVQQTKSVSVE